MTISQKRYVVYYKFIANNKLYKFIVFSLPYTYFIPHSYYIKAIKF